MHINPPTPPRIGAGFDAVPDPPSGGFAHAGYGYSIAAKYWLIAHEAR
ncbi:MAG: hypothetical protein LBE06_11160 [Azoarcus sp.]|jgi:hypothetical protein|nr:hypothetical protein [Azoarcus sp.]